MEPVNHWLPLHFILFPLSISQGWKEKLRKLGFFFKKKTKTLINININQVRAWDQNN